MSKKPESTTGMAAQAEQTEIMPVEQRFDELGDDGVVVADDAVKKRFSGAQLSTQVLANLFVDGAARDVAAIDQLPQLADRRNLGSGHRRFYPRIWVAG